MPNRGDFWNRLKKLYGPARTPQAPSGPVAPPPPRAPAPSSTPSYQQQAPQQVQQPMGPLDSQTKVSIIHQAGQQRKMLSITYDGVSRLVEPYSFRDRGTGLLFYGHCSIHNNTHSFKVEKIEEISITEWPFNPRWEIEL